MRLAPLCQAQEVDYVLLALYLFLALCLIIQCARILRYKVYKQSVISLLQHSLLLLVCVIRVVYLVAKPVIGSLAGLVLLGLLPSAVALSLFIHLLLAWASLQLTTLETSPFAKFRKPFFAVTLIVFLLVLLIVVLLAATPDMQIVRVGSYVFAALTALVCVLVLLSGLGLRRTLGSSSTLSSSSSSTIPKADWREMFRHRLLLATVGLSVCLFLVACLWAAAVQTDILMSSEATLATTTCFYIFDWLSLCVMTWLFSKAVRESVNKSLQQLDKTESERR